MGSVDVPVRATVRPGRELPEETASDRQQLRVHTPPSPHVRVKISLPCALPFALPRDEPAPDTSAERPKDAPQPQSGGDRDDDAFMPGDGFLGRG